MPDEVKKDLAVNKAIDFIRDHAEITRRQVAKKRAESAQRPPSAYISRR